jgi:hypothetical protein
MVYQLCSASGPVSCHLDTNFLTMLWVIVQLAHKQYLCITFSIIFYSGRAFSVKMTLLWNWAAQDWRGVALWFPLSGLLLEMFL